MLLIWEHYRYRNNSEFWLTATAGGSVWGGGGNSKNDDKARVATHQFDLIILPICGARTRSGAYVSIRHSGASTGPITQSFGKSHRRLFRPKC